jgi:hypothetical protein
MPDDESDGARLRAATGQYHPGPALREDTLTGMQEMFAAPGVLQSGTVIPLADLTREPLRTAAVASLASCVAASS